MEQRNNKPNQSTVGVKSIEEFPPSGPSKQLSHPMLLTIALYPAGLGLLLVGGEGMEWVKSIGAVLFIISVVGAVWLASGWSKKQRAYWGYLESVEKEVLIEVSGAKDLDYWSRASIKQFLRKNTGRKAQQIV